MRALGDPVHNLSAEDLAFTAANTDACRCASLTPAQAVAMKSKVESLVARACTCRGQGKCATCVWWNFRFHIQDLIAATLADGG